MTTVVEWMGLVKKGWMGIFRGERPMRFDFLFFFSLFNLCCAFFFCTPSKASRLTPQMYSTRLVFGGVSGGARPGGSASKVFRRGLWQWGGRGGRETDVSSMEYDSDVLLSLWDEPPACFHPHPSHYVCNWFEQIFFVCIFSWVFLS